MRLPNAERAFIDMRKLIDYCLNPSHPRGRHKAHVFQNILGFTAADAQTLYDALLAAAQTTDVEPGEQDEYGQRYTLDFELSGPAGTAVIRSSWIIRSSEDYPRLVSCYVM